MAALTTALVASAAIGAGASIYSASQQKKAIKNAANQTAQANASAINFAREGRDYARSVLSKYSGEGDAARNRMNAFLGIKPSASGTYSGAMGSAGGMPDYSGYVDRDPGLSGEWAKPQIQAQFGGDKSAYGQWHYSTLGQSQGFSAPPTSGSGGGAGSDPSAVPAETQEQAWAAYEASPWGKIGVMEADKARGDFLSMAGSQGGALSGRTARGLQEVGEESKLRNFGSYYGALGGVADMGYSADTGIASGGQTFANTASRIAQQGGEQQAGYSIAKGQTQADLNNDLASWIGWGMGQWPQGGGAPTTSTGVSGPGSSGRRVGGGIGSRIR